MVQSLFESVKPLAAETHGDWYLNTGMGYTFADRQPAVPLLVGEFAAAAREYPIAFLKQGDVFRPIAVLGLGEEENLVVDENGVWNGNYVPAFFRMYPFVMVKTQEQDRFGLGLAEDHPGLNKDGEGSRLFDENGELGDLLNTVQEFAKRYGRQSVVTDRFAEELSKLDIFAPVRMKLTGPGDMARSISGIFVVDRKKLTELNADELKAMVKAGSMEAIFLHLASLRNLKALAERAGHDAELPDDESAQDVADDTAIHEDAGKTKSKKK